jgi:hypothetical protein
MNELGVKFGRIQPLATELRGLAGRFPNSAAVKRHLAYLLWLLGKPHEAMNLYKEAALASRDTRDWHNVAVLALQLQQRELAVPRCYVWVTERSSFPAIR